MKNFALITDFGSRDWYQASMKGVILSITGPAQISDISHEISPGNIREASFVLEQCHMDFPEGTIFVAVVDPGVGTERKPIAVKSQGRYYVGPDNGLFAFLDTAKRVARLISNPKFTAASHSNTFHGRDIFAPAAAHLACGLSFESIGDTFDSMIKLDNPPPEFGLEIIRARVIHVDHFGNLITNISKSEWHARASENVILSCCGHRLQFHHTYGNCDNGKPLAYFGSGNFLEIAVNAERASERFCLNAGDEIELRKEKA